MRAIRYYLDFYYFYTFQCLDNHQLTKYKDIEIHIDISVLIYNLFLQQNVWFETRFF